MSIGLTVFSSEAYNPDKRNSFSTFWLGVCKRLSKQYRVQQLPLVTSEGLKICPYC